ncbi:putative GABA permease [Aspergillus vadensis CBS 113365]|uniref:Amino acid transporter n=1 Tax=Aspergillus vadensis (strain CBS 113365 / IMI 142717 / IBT 24658) TaxID=1448311 RepID=A0A319C767_ASPVC|nr:amino acid transporter [Aspergillus vadensis CBS 113365]PYH64672.1 amino acid transporter [Aspergillus vadensis CBS 113365]
MSDIESPGTARAELPRQFSFLSTLALGYSITNSWAGYAGILSIPLVMGGSPTAFFGLVVASIACCFITAGLAELASAFPTSGGPFHFAFMASAPKHRAAVSFVVGWLTMISWCTVSTSNGIVCAQMISGLVTVHRPSFTEAAWRIYLIYLLIVLLSTMVVCFLPRVIPLVEDFILTFSLLTFSASFITVLAMQDHKQSAPTVFFAYENHTGWGDGTAFMIGAGTCMYAYITVDSITHIADEVPEPGRNIPRAMMSTVLTGMVTCIPYSVTILFCTTDLNAVASSSIPIYTAYLQATSSSAVATLFTAWVIFFYCAAELSCILTAGRLAYTFARAGGLPYSSFFLKITNEMPLNATLGCCVFICLYGLIYIGSASAFNSLISIVIIELNICYVIPQGIVLLRGREAVLPRRAFALGKHVGPFCNAVAVLWVAVILVFFCLPLRLPTTVHDMNYVSVVLAGFVALIALGWWGGKRRTFTGPETEFPHDGQTGMARVPDE